MITETIDTQKSEERANRLLEEASKEFRDLKRFLSGDIADNEATINVEYEHIFSRLFIPDGYSIANFEISEVADFDIFIYDKDYIEDIMKILEKSKFKWRVFIN